MSKKYFEAIGRQMWSVGALYSSSRMRKDRLPDWSIDAVERGYQLQIPYRRALGLIKTRMAAESLQPKGQLMRIGGGL